MSRLNITKTVAVCNLPASPSPIGWEMAGVRACFQECSLSQYPHSMIEFVHDWFAEFVLRLAVAGSGRLRHSSGASHSEPKNKFRKPIMHEFYHTVRVLG